MWKEHSPQQWGLLHKFFGHEGSVNSIGWAPKEFGLRYTHAFPSVPCRAVAIGRPAVNMEMPSRHCTPHLGRIACASSDENLSILTYISDGQWSSSLVKAHKTGVNAVSWAPVTSKTGCMRLVTGGCDNLVKTWRWVPRTLRIILVRRMSVPSP